MSELLQGKEVIVFDLGNVVIDLHYHRTANQLAELEKSIDLFYIHD